MSRNLALHIMHGLEVTLPSLLTGELAYTTDTQEFFVGTASGNVRLNLPVYNPSGIRQGNVHVVVGAVTLSGGGVSIVTLAGPAAFSSATSYRCVVSDSTNHRVPQVIQTSGSSITFSGSGGDIINFICIGN